MPISDAGVIAASGGLKGYGWWEVDAAFTAPTMLVGTLRMRRANCDTGLLSYPNAITGDGYSGHEPDGGGHHHGRKYPDFDSATPKQRRQATRLHRRVLRKWSGMTLARARRLGYFRGQSTNKTRLGMFHVYNRRYEKDKRIFDARRPESLVFWGPPHGGVPAILGPMFRVAPGRRPRFAGPIPLYHSHQSKSGRVPSRMTHVWLVKRGARKSAWANCMPVPQLELYNPAFKWLPGWTGGDHLRAC